MLHQPGIRKYCNRLHVARIATIEQLSVHFNFVVSRTVQDIPKWLQALEFPETALQFFFYGTGLQLSLV
jgi:hypothetical protein